jgi:fermentation-respiration switch protein FrsA (DUF1100 family)
VFTREAPYLPPSPSLALNQQRVEFGSADETRFIAWVIPSLPQDRSDTWLLFFHGSGGNVSSDVKQYDDFRSMGFSVMAPEYPGYLDAPGNPSEDILTREAQAAYDYLRNEKHVKAKNIVIYGGSLGAAIAIDLASRVEAGALIAEAGFTSIVDMGRIAYPVLPIGFLVKNTMDSEAKIAGARMPVLLIHSRDDDVIPFELARKLYERASPPKKLVTLRGPHSPVVFSPLLNPGRLAEIVTFLNTEAGLQIRQPLPSIAPAIASTIDSAGVDSAIDWYRSLRHEIPPRYNFREAELNYLGYDLLDKKQIDEAISVFQLNAEQFPSSFDVFDSLGDGYVAAGRDSEAIQSYRKSLALFPGDANYSRPKLDRLERTSRSARNE